MNSFMNISLQSCAFHEFGGKAYDAGYFFVFICALTEMAMIGWDSDATMAAYRQSPDRRLRAALSAIEKSLRCLLLHIY